MPRGHGGGPAPRHGGGPTQNRNYQNPYRNPGVDPRLWQMIVHFSGPLRLDPYAVAAVSRVEGGGRFGEVGDGGSSFGPFQLHVGGALPAGRDAAWANSAQGVLYALTQMSHSGAAGLRGLPAVRAIVYRFERPAAPGPEVANAWGGYRSFGSVPVSGPGGGGGGGGAGMMGSWQHMMSAQMAGQRQLAQMLARSQAQSQRQFVAALQSQAAQTRQQALSDQVNAKIGAARTAQQSLSGGTPALASSDPAAQLAAERKLRLQDIRDQALRRAGVL